MASIAVEHEEQDLSLALSGGGLRSALFGLGALHFVFDSGMSLRLHTIASVSGGSYTNAQALLLGAKMQEVEDDETVDVRAADGSQFEEHFKPFVRSMTDGSPFRTSRVIGLSALIATVASIGILNIRLVDGLRRAMLGSRHWVMRPIATIAGLALVPSWGRALAKSIWCRLFPGIPADRALGTKRMDKVTNVRPGGEPIRRVLQPSKHLGLAAKPSIASAFSVAPDLDEDRTVHHVFSATDLHHDGFIYLADDFVYNRRLGFGSPADFSIKTAVDASSAIPPIFAPVRVSTEGFIQLPPDAPGFLLAADGGVHDTLAVEWFREGHELVGKNVDGPDLDILTAHGIVLVVDGSAPLRIRPYIRWTTFWAARSLIPVLWWLVGHIRSVTMAMSNWDRRNFRALSTDPEDRMIGISIAETPFAKIDGKERTNAQRRQLARHKLDWRALVRANGEVGTRPHKLSADRAARLVYHGYVMAWAALTDDEPPELPSLEEYQARWFDS